MSRAEPRRVVRALVVELSVNYRLDGGGSHTTTERVGLSLQDARKVDQNDGWVTVQTTAESDDTIVTLQEDKRV